MMTFKNLFYFEEVKPTSQYCESRRWLLAKKQIPEQSLGPGNFLTASNSFVLKENNPFNQFQMYSQVLFPVASNDQF